MTTELTIEIDDTAAAVIEEKLKRGHLVDVEFSTRADGKVLAREAFDRNTADIKDQLKQGIEQG